MIDCLIVDYAFITEGTTVYNSRHRIVVDSLGVRAVGVYNRSFIGNRDTAVKELLFSKDTGDGEERIKREMVYMCKDSRLLPVWVVEFNGLHYLFDAKTGGVYEE